MVDVTVTLTGGEAHDGDSSELAFHVGTANAVREAVHQAGPLLLEPVFRVTVTTPQEYVGDIIGNLHARRGTVEGIDNEGTAEVVLAHAPLAELFGYTTDLRSLSQGRASATVQFERYQPVPKTVSEQIVRRIQGW